MSKAPVIFDAYETVYPVPLLELLLKCWRE
jgi:hypothetical protein